MTRKIKNFKDVISGSLPPNSTSLFTMPNKNGFNQLIQQFRQIADPCILCFRRCEAHRLSGQTGFCGISGEGGQVIYASTLCGEEPILNPTYEVFLSGCNVRCGFCYEKHWVENPLAPKYVGCTEMAKNIKHAIPEKAGNLHWVGGEPTLHLPWIMRVLAELSGPVPIVWNSNMAMSKESCELLLNIPDLILADIHFGNDDCAMKIAGSSDFLKASLEAIEFFAHKIDMIVRYLYLAGHFECCFVPIVDWLSKIAPDRPFHIMSQYVPPVQPQPDVPEVRPLPDELDAAKLYAKSRGLKLLESIALPSSGPLAEKGFETEIQILADGAVSIRNFIGDFIDLVTHLTDDRGEIVNNIFDKEDVVGDC